MKSIGAFEITLAGSDEEIQRCFPIMKQLRPHLRESEFIETVRRLEKIGFRLVFGGVDRDVKSVAGFRITENLDNGRFMYVDDLVTNSNERSEGYGQRLFDWLQEYATREGCTALTLDSGVQRFDAHRFYLRNGMRISSHHFWMQVSGNKLARR